jgi:hypothetical protein
MKLNGPIVTLLAGVVVGAGLLVANDTLTGNDDTATQVAATAAAGAGSASASASTSPPVPASPSASASASAGASVAAVSAGVVATYAGHVYDGATKGGSLSVVIKGDTAIAYLCDGKIEAWLWGTASGNSLSLKNKDGATLTATRGGGKVTGTISAAGGSWTFALPAVKKPSGLYRSTAKIRGATVVSGWVVLPDGTQVGMSSNGSTEVPAPPIDLGTGRVTIDGTQVTATEADPAEVVPAG